MRVACIIYMGQCAWNSSRIKMIQDYGNPGDDNINPRIHGYYVCVTSKAVITVEKLFIPQSYGLPRYHCWIRSYVCTAVPSLPKYCQGCVNWFSDIVLCRDSALPTKPAGEPETTQIAGDGRSSEKRKTFQQFCFFSRRLMRWLMFIRNPKYQPPT